jgi:hypothetical protein
MAEKEKLKAFHESIIEDYNRSLEVEDLAIVKTTEKPDCSSIQIGMRTNIPEEVFDSLYQSFGKEVAMGERDFLIDYLLKCKEIQRVHISEDTKFTEHLEFNKNIVILSTKFYVGIFTKLMNHVVYGKGHPLLYGIYPIISIPEKILGNKIIIVEKDAILIEKELFSDELTGKKEKINVITKNLIDGVEVMFRSVLRIKHIDFERIKILEVED